MKHLSALAGVLLLSSSLLAGCTPNASPAPDNRADTYDTTQGGRVQGGNMGINTVDRDRLGVADDIGPDRGAAYDEDRLGVIDRIGPDRRPGVMGNGNTRDKDRLGVRDNIGPDTNGRNLRNDTALESKVEAIPGVRDAKVLVVGNTAYVGINTRFDDTTRDTTPGPNVNATGNDRPRMNTTNGNNRPNVTLRNAVGGAMNGATGSPTGNANVQGYSYGSPGTTGTGNTAGSYGSTSGTSGTTPGATTNNRNYANSMTTPGNNISTPVIPNNIGINGLAGGANAGRQGTVNRYTGGAGNQYSTAGQNTSNNNAGIFNANMDHAVSGGMKTRVATAIRQANPSIQNVYVSANPQLFDRMGAYTNDSVQGRVTGAGNDLMDALRRVFPAAR